MWIDEHDTKMLLRAAGVDVPSGVVVEEHVPPAPPTLGFPVYVKALVPDRDRASAGGVVRVDDPARLPEAVRSVRAAMHAGAVRIEEACSADTLWYLSMGIPAGASVPVVLFSREGGSGIELRDADVVSVSIEPGRRLTPGDIGAIAAAAGLEPRETALLTGLALACWEVLVGCDATLLELNPLGVTADRIVALDARMTIDDYALFRHPDLESLASVSRARRSVAGALAARGIDYVRYRDRGIGIVGLGAGLTMHLADWIDTLGGTAGFFFDATRSAVADWEATFRGDLPERFRDDLVAGLGLVAERADVLLVNFTSGGTPVDSLAKALVAALPAIPWTGPLVVHVAGNRSGRAIAQLAEAGITPAGTLEEAVIAAVERQRDAASRRR